jgi:hypothetical protein
MITYTITGPKTAIERQGRKLQSTLQTEGQVVAYFPQPPHPDMIPNPAVTVIIILKPED